MELSSTLLVFPAVPRSHFAIFRRHLRLPRSHRRRHLPSQAWGCTFDGVHARARRAQRCSTRALAPGRSTMRWAVRPTQCACIARHRPRASWRDQTEAPGCMAPSTRGRQTITPTSRVPSASAKTRCQRTCSGGAATAVRMATPLCTRAP